MLVTDVYPPFSREADAPFPIAIELPEPGPLNRAAVLFRLILVVPAAFIQGCLTSGFALLSFPIWVSALITGRLPIPIFKAVATIVRFHMRVGAYILLLTSKYPWGWKGELSAPPLATSALPPPPAVPAPSSASAWPTEGGLPSYPTPTASLSDGGEEFEFDFVLTEWVQGWLWIFLIVGLASDAVTRSQGNQGGMH